MSKRLVAMAAVMALALSLAACGSEDKSPTVTPTPTPPTRAEITFRLDPPTVTAVSEGGGRYAYNVNLEFFDSAGVGFFINTIELTISTASGTVVLNDVDVLVPPRYVGPLGRHVMQYTVRYNAGGTRVALVTRFTVSFTDDRGNALTATAQVNVLRHGEPQRLP